MARRHSKKHAGKAQRRLLAGVGGGASAIVAAAALATGSAAPAHADFEDLLDPIIQPLLASLTDSLSAIDPAAAVDITSWTDSLLSGLNSIDLALPTTAESAAAAASSAEPAATTGTYILPITMQEVTEPTVQAAVDGGSPVPVLVDTGSSGLVIPWQDLGSGSEFQELLNLGFPVSFGESGYSGGVDYIYLTYDLPVNYADGLETTGPVEVEVYSWDPSDFSSFFTNDAFQDFLASNDSAGGVLGIGDHVSGGAGTSPFDSYGSVLLDIKNGELVVGGTNPYPVLATASGNGSTFSGLTETVTHGGNLIGTGTVSDDLDSGGVYGTIPSSIAGGSTLANGDLVTVSDGNGELYSYTVETDAINQSESPTLISGNSIDSGVIPFYTHALFIDYANGTTSLDAAGS